jgi:hypothetical protein
MFLSGDCHNSRGQQGMCVVGAINNYTDQLYSYGQKTSCKCVTNTNYCSLQHMNETLFDLAHRPAGVTLSSEHVRNQIT